MMKGSKFADRMPIGLESIIRNVPAETVKAFYRRWYQPGLMAAIAVGDFEVSHGLGQLAAVAVDLNACVLCTFECQTK
jgi:predicted Zn-dependent peptidase